MKAKIKYIILLYTVTVLISFRNELFDLIAVLDDLSLSLAFKMGYLSGITTVVILLIAISKKMLERLSYSDFIS